MFPSRRCAAVALLCAGCLFAWQVLTVRYSYGGNWTGLFCTGTLRRLKAPPALASENILLLPNSHGYDGQFYHYIAHDPFFTRGFAASIDVPGLRYRRILVPALAFLLALGQDPAVDAAYIFVVAAFVFLGAYWLSRIAVSRGRNAAFGLLFAAAPAALVSVDRLTVDVALAACCVGFALYAREQASFKLYSVLAAAALARETGLLLVAAYCLYLLGERRIRSAFVFASAALPTAGWYVFVWLHVPSPFSGFLSPLPFAGFLHRVLNPYPYPFGPAIVAIASILDLLALAGIGVAFVWTLHRAFRRAWTPEAVAMYLFAVLAAVLSSRDAWSEVYAFGRTLTPLLLFAALDGASAGSILPLLGMLAVDPRIGLQVGGQVLNVLRGIWR